MTDRHKATTHLGMLDDIDVITILESVGNVEHKYKNNTLRPHEQAAIEGIKRRAAEVLKQTRDMVNTEINELLI